MTLEHRLRVENLVYEWAATSFLMSIFLLFSWKHSVKCLENQIVCPTQIVTMWLKCIFYSRVKEHCGIGGYNFSLPFLFWFLFFWFPSQNTQWNGRKTETKVVVGCSKRGTTKLFSLVRESGKYQTSDNNFDKKCPILFQVDWFSYRLRPAEILPTVKP